MEIKCEKTFLRHTKEISYHTILFFFLASSHHQEKQRLYLVEILRPFF